MIFSITLRYDGQEFVSNSGFKNFSVDPHLATRMIPSQTFMSCGWFASLQLVPSCTAGTKMPSDLANALLTIEDTAFLSDAQGRAKENCACRAVPIPGREHGVL